MPQVKHVVLLRFKPGFSDEAASKLLAELDGLREKVPGLLDFSGGPNNSPEGLHRGFTHGFVMTFADAASRDAYLPHPEHEKVKTKIIEALDGNLDGNLEGALIFDWLE